MDLMPGGGSLRCKCGCSTIKLSSAVCADCGAAGEWVLPTDATHRERHSGIGCDERRELENLREAKRGFDLHRDLLAEYRAAMSALSMEAEAHRKTKAELARETARRQAP